MRDMPKILFRGKKLDNGSWVCGSLLSFDCCKKAILPSAAKVFKQQGTTTICCNECYDVNPDTVGQYTGLADKNGTKIFEGDIVSGEQLGNKIFGVICWINDIAGFGVRYRRRDEPTAWENSSILRNICRNPKLKFAAEVIGNIHDNPELLEGGGVG